MTITVGDFLPLLRPRHAVFECPLYALAEHPAFRVVFESRTAKKALWSAMSRNNHILTSSAFTVSGDRLYFGSESEYHCCLKNCNEAHSEGLVWHDSIALDDPEAFMVALGKLPILLIHPEVFPESEQAFERSLIACHDPECSSLGGGLRYRYERDPDHNQPFVERHSRGYMRITLDLGVPDPYLEDIPLDFAEDLRSRALAWHTH